MMPNGWSYTKFENVVENIYGGGTPSRNNPVYWNGNIPWVTVKDLKSDYIDGAEEHITQIGLDESSSKIVPKGLVIISTRMAVGKAVIPMVDVAINQDLKAIKPKKNYDSKFIFYWYKSKSQYLESLGTGSTVKGIQLSDIKTLRFPDIPLSEQQKIAEILSTWDKAINTTERLVDSSKQLKKALMQQLLTGRKRLLDNNGKPFEGEWLTKKLVDITTRVQRKSDGNDHPILTISSLSGFMTQKERYSRFMAGESLKKYVLLKNGEFAYNKGNSKTYQFGCIFKLEDFETGLVPNIYVCFRINNDLCEDFYKYLFEADYLKPQLGRLVNTGVRNDGLLNIKPNEFLNTTVPAPPLDEQQKIAAVLTNASREIELLEQQLADLQQEKKALMQQLLTGKKRVTL